MIAVLRRRDFSLLWLAGFVSIGGDWVLMTALPFFVYVVTGSTLATAGMTVAELAPAMFLASPAGVLVDRWDRKRVLVVANLTQAAVVAALLLVDEDQLWVVYVVAAAQSSVAAFSGPAESALLPTLVPRDLLVQANAMNALNNRLGRLAGVPLGAALLTWLGLEAVVLVDVVTFLVAATLVLPIAAPHTRPESGALPEAETGLSRFWREWMEGLQIVRGDGSLQVLFPVFALMTFGGTMLDPLHVAWVRDVLGEGVDVIAMLSLAGSLAGVAGSLLVGAFGSRLPARVLMGWGSCLAGVLLLVRFNVPHVGLAVALSVVGGVTAVASSVGVETLAQERTPDAVRGRIFGSLQASIWLASLLGAAVGGVVGRLAGVRPALDVAAALVVVSGLVVLVAIPRVPEHGGRRAGRRRSRQRMR